MARAIDVSGRAFLTGLAGLAAARAFAADPPRIEKRVERLYKIKGSTQPNDLQFVADGLWVLDQVDPNKAFKVRPEDGTVPAERFRRGRSVGLNRSARPISPCAC